MWSIDDQTTLVSGWRPRRLLGSGGQITDGCLSDFGMSGSGHTFDGNAVIDNGGVVHRVVVDNGGLLVNIFDLGFWQTMTSHIAVAKLTQSNEYEVVEAQAKIEA